MASTRPIDRPQFTRFRGDTKTLKFPALTDDNGNILKPSEHELYLSIEAQGGSAPLVQKQKTLGGFAVTDDNAGLFEVKLLPADDAALALDTPYDLVVVAQHNTTGDIARIRGTLILFDGILDAPEITIPSNVEQPSTYQQALADAVAQAQQYAAQAGTAGAAAGTAAGAAAGTTAGAAAGTTAGAAAGAAAAQDGANLARDWARKTDGPVDEETGDLSAKANALLTAADRVQTGLDVQAAETARSLAEAAQAGASAIAAGNLLPLVNTRALADYLDFDPFTSGARAFWNLASCGFDLATAPLTLSVWWYNDGVAKTSVRGLIGLSSSNSNVQFANSIEAYISTTDQLYVLHGGNPAGNYHALFRNAISTSFSVGWHLLTITWDRINQPAVYIDGIAQGMAATSGGTPPAWTAAIAATYVVLGIRAAAEQWVGGLIPAAPINAVLSPSEVLTFAQTGRLPRWCSIAVGAAPIYTSDFSATADSWTSVLATTLTGNIDAIGGRDDNLRLVATSVQLGATRTLSVIAGRAYRFRASVYRPSGNVSAVKVALTDGGNATFGLPVQATVPDAWTDLDVTFVAANTPSLVRLMGCTAGGSVGITAGDTLYLRGVSLTPCGPAFRPVIQPCRIVDDAGVNGIAGMITPGVTPITAKRDWRLRATVDMSATGNKQLFGSAVFFDPTAHAIDTIDAKCSGAPTFSIGDGTTADKYTGSAAHVAGPTREALLSNYPADAAKTGIYANVTATGGSAESIVIRGHRID